MSRNIANNSDGNSKRFECIKNAQTFSMNIQTSMAKSFLDDKNIIKKKHNSNANSNNNLNFSNSHNNNNNHHHPNNNKSNNNKINSSIQSIQSMMKSMKVYENKKKKNALNNNKNNNLNSVIIQNENSIKDISHITKNDNFIFNSIENSIFNEYDDLQFSEIKYNNFSTCSNNNNQYTIINNMSSSNINNNNDLLNENLSNYYKEKIANANWNEEIVLPDKKLTMKFLNINKPIKLKGQISSELEITEGPILINIAENVQNDSVKISQIKIIFNDSALLKNEFLNNNTNIDNKTKEECNNINTNSNIPIHKNTEDIINNRKKPISNLFKLNQGSLLELEDCDIIYQNNTYKKQNYFNNSNYFFFEEVTDLRAKSVAFLLYGCKNIMVENPLTSVLTITNTRIFNFYQTVRAGHNCILNIDKSSISQNYGKSIVVINPLIMKINETTFESNSDDAIHIKFLSDGLNDEKKTFYFNKNTFENNMGNAICFEGLKGYKFNLSIVMTENIIKHCNNDGVILWDLTFDSFDIINNVFSKNRGNGLNLQKIYPYNYEEGEIFFNPNNNSLSKINTDNNNIINTNLNNNKITSNNNSLNNNSIKQSTSNIGVSLNNENNNNSIPQNKLKIKDNVFSKNIGFGLFVNDSQVEVISNKFITNKASGMILCSLILDNQKSSIKANNPYSYTGQISTEMSTDFISFEKKVTKLIQNLYAENGESGLKIINYTYPVYAEQNMFNENCEHGIFIDLDSNLNISGNLNNNNNNPNLLAEKIKLYKSIDNNQAILLSNLILSKCIIEKNLKSGINLNNCFIFCEESYINDNIGYAIYTPKKELRNCFKESKLKNKKNNINGVLGGEWGEVNINEKTTCSVSCGGTNSVNTIKLKKDSIQKKIVGVNNINNNENNPNNLYGSNNNMNIPNSNNINNNNANNNNSSIDANNKSNKNHNNNNNEGCIVN